MRFTETTRMLSQVCPPPQSIVIHAYDILRLSRQGRIRKDGEGAHNAHVRRYILLLRLLFSFD